MSSPAAAPPTATAVVQIPRVEAEGETGPMLEGGASEVPQREEEEVGEGGSENVERIGASEKATEKGSKKKTKKKTFKASTGGKGRNTAHVDVLGPVAMENALLICHSVQDLLACRGYPWPLAQAKTGGKKKK